MRDASHAVDAHGRETVEVRAPTPPPPAPPTLPAPLARPASLAWLVKDEGSLFVVRGNRRLSWFHGFPQSTDDYGSVSFQPCPMIPTLRLPSVWPRLCFLPPPCRNLLVCPPAELPNVSSSLPPPCRNLQVCSLLSILQRFGRLLLTRCLAIGSFITYSYVLFGSAGSELKHSMGSESRGERHATALQELAGMPTRRVTKWQQQQ